MDDIYQHPVFFECDSLHEEQIRKVEKYFRVRRKSGGGDCGPLRRIKDNVYCIAFKNHQDQHRVLQRFKHEPEGVSLVFTVQSSFESQNPSTTTASTSSEELTESPECVPTSTTAPSDEAYDGISTGNHTPSDLGFTVGAAAAAAQDTATRTAAGAPENGVSVEIVEGTIETQQSPECVPTSTTAPSDDAYDGISMGNHTPSDLGFTVGAAAAAAAQDTATRTAAGAPENGVSVEIVEGTIETQQSPECVPTSTTAPSDEAYDGISMGNHTPSDLGFTVGAAAAQDTATRTAAGAPENGVSVEIVEGTIETQQVDALVSPMVGHDPLSTRVGNTLYSIVGSQLTARFRKQADEETMPGDTVLMDDLSGLPSEAVFFLTLIPWDGDQDGTPVQVLRLGIQKILISCEQRGFRSVALPLLGTGIALQFPDIVVARLLLEEIHAFDQSRASSAPLLVRITIHPNDKESSEIFKLVQEAFKTEVFQPDHGSSTKRVVILGKTGAGKSNLANTIFGEELFATNPSPNSETKQCQAETRVVSERSITLIDTPGLFDTGRSEEKVKPETLNCITECAPGPHAFLIVLKVEKYTEQEQDVVTKICKYFSEDALKYAVIVFTHGDQLPKGMKIEEFVSQNMNLRDLVEKCGGRCHVFDNKYWKNKQQNNYRSNQFQVEELLNAIDKMVMENNGGYYTNEFLQVVEAEIKKEEEHIKLSSGNMQLAEIRKQAKITVSQRFWIQMAGTATGVFWGALFGVAAMIKLALTAVTNREEIIKLIKRNPPVGKAVTAAAGGELVAAAGVGIGVTVAAVTVTGGVMGGVIGHNAVEGAETVQEAVEMAAKAVKEKAKATLQLEL